MISNKTVSFMAIIVAMVFVCHMTSAADLVPIAAVNGISNETLVSSTAVPVAPIVASNHHLNGKNLKYIF